MVFFFAEDFPQNVINIEKVYVSRRKCWKFKESQGGGEPRKILEKCMKVVHDLRSYEL